MKTTTQLYALYLALISIFIFNAQKANACHAIALVNYNQQTINATSVFVNAASDSPTCGCAPYWLDCEVRCLNEPFDAAPFSPGFHGPLATYPYFQSAQMTKNNCAVVNYPGITIPFANLCPGMTYQYRMRENHHGQVGPWCPAQTFTVPGATQPIVAGATSTQTTICAGDCVNLSSSVVQGCGLAASYTWDNGLGAGQNQTVCPNVTTTYTVTIDEQCSGFQDQASVTINVVPPPVNGVAAISQTTICAGTPVDLSVVGQQGTIQWQSAPNAGGPWTNIAGATNANYTDPNPIASTCYRAEITGCAPPPAGIQQLYTNVVCVTVDPAPVADFTYTPTCNGPTPFQDLSSSGSAITNWDWDFDGDGVIDDTQQNPSYTFVGNGPFNVTLTVTNSTGCTHTVTLPVTPPAAATPNFAFVAACPGAATALTDQSVVGGGANITNWDWDIDGDGVIDYTTQNPNHVFNTSGVHNVELTVTTNNGCVSTITLPVTIPEIPVASFQMQNVCDGQVGNFNDNSTVGGSTIANWSWDMDGDLVEDYNTQNVAHTYPTNNAYNVTLTVTSADGCVDDTTQTVQIFPNPTADFTSTQPCLGTDMDFTDVSVGNGGTINTWDWDFDGDGVIDNTQQNPSYGFPAAGNFNVDLTVTTVNGCSGTINLPVTVHAQPTADFTFTSVCEGNNVNFTDASTIVNGTISSWEWDFDGPGSSNVQNPTQMFTTEDVYDVELIVETAAGCADTIVIPVDIYPNPVADFTPQSVCLNVPVNFGDASTVSNANTTNNIVQWDWDLDIATSNQQNPPTQTYTVAGQYTISLTVTTDNGCTDMLSVPIDIYDKPTADFTFTDDCENQSIIMNDASTIPAGVIDTWQWDVDGDWVTDYTTQNISHLYANSGTYNVSLIVSSGNGCGDTIIQQVTAFPMPLASFTTADECVYDQVCFNDNSQVAAPDNIISHTYTFGDGSPLSATQNPCHQYASAGQYFITQIVTTNNGCADDTTIAVTVHPQPSISFTSSAVCENEPPTTFTNTSNISTGTISQWNWNFDDGGPMSSLQDPTHIYADSGTYNVTLIGLSDFGCSDTATQPVIVYPKPIAVMSADVYEGCTELCVNFGADASVSNATSITNWDWTMSDGFTSSSSSPNNCFVNNGLGSDVTYDVGLIVTNNFGCKDTVENAAYITVHPLPVASFYPTPPVTDEFNASINFVNESMGADSYYWTFGDGDNATDIEPEHMYNDIGQYNVTLVASTIYGCVDSISDIVIIEPVPTVYVPNAFTPDDDGINDGFVPEIYGYQDLTEYQFLVFDRWGQIVFESYTPGEAWNGSIKGIQVDSKTDVYVWKLVLTDSKRGKEEYVGHVTMLK